MAAPYEHAAMVDGYMLGVMQRLARKASEATTDPRTHPRASDDAVSPSPTPTAHAATA